MQIEREQGFNFRLSENERAKLQALAEDEDMAASALVRRWIRQRYEARFGEASVAPSTPTRARAARR